MLIDHQAINRDVTTRFCPEASTVTKISGWGAYVRVRSMWTDGSETYLDL